MTVIILAKITVDSTCKNTNEKVFIFPLVTSVYITEYRVSNNKTIWKVQIHLS